MNNIITFTFAFGAIAYSASNIKTNHTNINTVPTDITSSHFQKAVTPTLDFREYVTLKGATAPQSDVDILMDFVTCIVANSKPLNADISNLVMENFWDLI